MVLLPLWNRRDADGPVHRKWQNPVLRAWSRIQLCVICLMMINLISRKANFVVSGKINQHLSYFPASDGSSCVCPHAAILAHLCSWFATHYRTSARIEGTSLKQENASVTLVASTFCERTRKSLIITFHTMRTRKSWRNQRAQRSLLSQKQLQKANHSLLPEWQISVLIGCQARTSSPVTTGNIQMTGRRFLDWCWSLVARAMCQQSNWRFSFVRVSGFSGRVGWNKNYVVT